MNTRHLVDPALIPILDTLPVVELNADTLPYLREGERMQVEQQAELAPPSPDIDVSERLVAGPAGSPDVRVLVYLPRSAPRPLPAVLWIHGGGYVMGTADGVDLEAKDLARAIGCAVAVVDYRLAPETPHPGPVEDCHAALVWLHAQAAALEVDPARIAVVGASAGGGLAAALALLARDRDSVPLAFQLLVYPMLDDRTAASADPHPYTGAFNWTPRDNRFGWSALLGREPGGEGVSPYAAAARAENLAGLPPAYISTGALDLFLEEDMEYARRLIRAGVPTELHVYPGAYHGYSMVPHAWMSQAEAANSRAALRRALRPGAYPSRA